SWRPEDSDPDYTLDPEEPVYVLVTVVFVGLMQGFFNAKARFLLPAFPAFLPVARLLSSCPRWVQVIFVFAVTGLSTWWSLDVLSGNISP
ncbi:hypothetical protein V7F95_08050, partial [Cutibacterium avidum]